MVITFLFFISVKKIPDIFGNNIKKRLENTNLN